MIGVIKAYSEVLSFIHKNKVWSFYWLPLVFNLTLLVLLYLLLSSNIDSITVGVVGFFYDGQVDLDSWISLFIKTLAYMMMLFYIYQPLSLILLAPLFSLLSENVHDCLNDNKTSFNMSRFWIDVKRGVKIGLKNVIIQFPVLAILFFIGVIIPFLAPFMFFASFFVSSYFYGFTMMDYRNEYYRLNPEQSRDYVNLKFFQTLTIGVIFQFILYIPIIGTIFGPSYALVATALSSDKK